MKDRHQAQAYPLRLPEGLKAQVMQSAEAMGRSLNAEITARLQASFSELGGISFAVQQAVDQVVEETGCTPAEALDRLVLAGQSSGGTVLHVRLGPNTTIAQVKSMLNIAAEHVPPDANIVIDRDSI